MEGLPEGGLVFQKVPDTQHTSQTREISNGKRWKSVSFYCSDPFILFWPGWENASAEGFDVDAEECT